MSKLRLFKTRKPTYTQCQGQDSRQGNLPKHNVKVKIQDKETYLYPMSGQDPGQESLPKHNVKAKIQNKEDYLNTMSKQQGSNLQCPTYPRGVCTDST